MDLALIIALVLIGVFTGVVTGLTGASGVIVVVPLVNLLMNFSMHESIGTSLMVDIIAPLAISYTYYRHGNINIRSGVWIAIGSIFGAQVGATFAAGVPEVSLGGTFGLFMVIMGVLLWRRGFDQQSIAEVMRGVIKLETQTQRVAAALILGFTVGLMTGILGAGGGGMILLILIFVLNFPIHTAIGTSALIMAITASSGAMGYALHGTIRPLSGLLLGISAAASGIASARFANKVSEETLTKVVGVIFIVLGVFMTTMYLRGPSINPPIRNPLQIGILTMV